MARLYNIDTPEGLSDCLNAFQTAFEDFRTLARGRDMEFINDALDDSRPISPRLYQLYSETLRKAVGMAGVSQDLQDQWLANVSRFAAYKAARATDMIRDAVAANDEKRDGTGPLRAHARYLAAEANTARTRARTGKQWQQFSDPDHARLFPNIRWIASRSATPREAHMPFYGRVWAKDDPFWQHNQPGTLWNCKCDWEETDDPVTNGNPQKNIELPGLKGNPAETGQIFSEDAPYFSRCSNSQQKKIEAWAKDNIIRHNATNALNGHMGTTAQVDLQGQRIDVLFDGKTKSHIANDAAQAHDFLLSEISSRLPEILRESKLVAHEPNMKPNKKPSARHYYYYKYILGNKAYYLNVEENYVEMENRHFYRLYSICTKLRETAIKY